MPDKPETFTWADAWILMAIFIGQARNSPAVDLTRIITIGDALEHAILTRGELEHGQRRLIAAGFVDRKPRGYRVLESHFADARFRSAVERRVEGLREFLGAPPWDSSYVPPVADSEQYVTEAEYRKAVGYYEEVRKT